VIYFQSSPYKVLRLKTILTTRPGLMGKKTVYERFIWFDKRARSGRYPNASSLAERFEISRRTAQRDIEFMRDRLAAPLAYDASRKGYSYEDQTFTLPSIFLSTDEISSLLIARKVLRDISGGNLGRKLSDIIRKLTACLDDYHEGGLDMDGIISLQHIEYLPAEKAVFRTVLEGCIKRKRLLLAYGARAIEDEEKRRVDPYHVFNYKGTWHLLAYCHKRRGIRDFVLARIFSVALTDEQFERPKDFDPDEYFRTSFGLYRGGRRYRVRLKFISGSEYWVSGRVWHEDQEVRVQKDGSILLTFTATGLTEVKSVVMKYGSLVEVISPKVLREMVREEAAKTARLYRK